MHGVGFVPAQIARGRFDVRGVTVGSGSRCIPMPREMI